MDNHTKELGKSLLQTLTKTNELLGGHPGKDEKWYRTFKGWKSAFEFAAIFFAMGYACVTYRQWQDAGLNFKVSQRPWVGPDFPLRADGVPIISQVGPNQNYRWDYLFKNYGNSPALRARGHSRTYLLFRGNMNWEEVKKDIENLELLQNSETTIFNNEEAPDSGVSRIPLSLENSNEVQNGSALIVLGGRIEYFDEAGARHNTTWCIIYVPNPIGTKPAVRWHSCPINPIAN
jgi:hypothetical protein